MSCPVNRPECSCPNCTTAMIRAHAPHLLAPSHDPATPLPPPSNSSSEGFGTKHGTGMGAPFKEA